MTDWNQLKTIVDSIAKHSLNPHVSSLNAIYQLQRTLQVTASYHKHKIELAKRGITVEQHIRDTYFSRHQSVVVCKNSYPYHLKPSIEHWLVWCNPNVLTEAEFLKSIPTLMKSYFQNCKTLWFQNPPEWRSVKSVPHVHVFVLK